MNRRGVWLTIICIIMVGVSVTRTTKNFLASRGLDTAAIAGLTEETRMAKAEPETTGAAAGEAEAAEEQAEDAGPGAMPRAVLYDAGLAGNGSTVGAGNPGEGAGAAMEAGNADADSNNAGNTGAGNADAGDGSTGNTGAAVGAGSVLAEPSDTVAPGTAGAAGTAGGAGAGNSGTSMSGASGSMGPVQEALQADGTALAEAVKSPLEPADHTAAQDTVTELQEKTYTAAELKERLGTAADQIGKNKEPSDANPASLYAAAEYEWNIWDKELNLIYSCIRRNMSEVEAEKLKHEEVAWLMERDQAADRAGLKSNSQPGQNAEYVKASASKTKERCYKLLEDYGDVIDRNSSDGAPSELGRNDRKE